MPWEATSQTISPEVEEVLLPAEQAAGRLQDVRRRTERPLPQPMTHEDLLPFEEGQHARDQEDPTEAPRGKPLLVAELDPLPGGGPRRGSLRGGPDPGQGFVPTSDQLYP